MHKKSPLISSFIIMLCLGSIYAWSIFVPELIKIYQLTTAQTQLIFGTVIGVFPLTMIWAARFNKKLGYKVVATISGILYFTGYLVAFLSKGNFLILWLGIGVIVGMGTGIGYLISLSAPLKWYPNKKGFVTGIVVAGFGAGAIILTHLASYLIKQNIDVLRVFLFQGIIHGILILLAAQKLKEPLNVMVSAKKALRVSNKHGVYLYQLILGIFAGTFTGLLVIGNLKPIAQLKDISDLLIPLSISLFALANFTGRITWGWLSDKFGNIYLIPTALIAQACASLLLFFVPLSNVMFVSLVIIIGFTFGANFVLFAKETISKFGQESYERIYPFIFLGYALAGIAGPYAGGRVFDVTGSYLHAIGFAFVISMMASITFVFIQKGMGLNKTNKMKTKLLKASGKEV